VHEEGFYGAHDIELRLGRTATTPDTTTRTLETDDDVRTGCCWRAVVDESRLADPDIPLDQFVTGATV
jgi:hypothetical protein